jgi:hypothetical protein
MGREREAGDVGVSRKEEILRRAEELKKEEESRQQVPPDRPYTGRGMMSRMPLGCWLWVLGFAAIAFYAFSRFIGGVH